MNIYKCHQCGRVAVFPDAESHALLKCPYCGHSDYAMAWRDAGPAYAAASLAPHLRQIQAELKALPDRADVSGTFKALSSRFGLSTFSLIQIAHALCAPMPDSTLPRLHRFAQFAPSAIDGNALLQAIHAELTKLAQSMPAAPAQPAQSPWEDKYNDLQKEHEALKRDYETLKKKLADANKRIKELEDF